MTGGVDRPPVYLTYHVAYVFLHSSNLLGWHVLTIEAEEEQNGIMRCILLFCPYREECATMK
jgi:hypothetical protein